VSDRVLFIGDALLDRYSRDGQLHLRAGCVANLLRAARFEGNSIDLLTTFPDPELLRRLLPSGEPGLEVTVLPSHGPLNVVEYVVVDGRVAQVDDRPRPCRHDFDEHMAAIVLAAGYDVIAVADYALGTLAPRTKAAIRSLAAAGQAQVLVDARHANFDDYRGASWFLPTIEEFLRYRAPRPGDERSPAWFIRQLDAAGVVLKKSSNGLQVVTFDGREFELPGLPERQVVDAFGAGDMLLGGLATRMRREGVTEDSLRRVLEGVFERLRQPAAGELERAGRTRFEGAAPRGLALS
jgi:D-beta-D-heptose 7-phosphate kinase/D-beta-D-heptose 1-phosphate adenosyltransferase